MKFSIRTGGERSLKKFEILRGGVPRAVWVPAFEIHGMLHLDVAKIIEVDAQTQIGDVVMYGEERLRVVTLDPVRVSQVIDEGAGKCDFCGEHSDKWKDYHCATFDNTVQDAFPGSGGPELRTTMTGDWSACPACAFLIDEDKWEELARRSVSMERKRGALDSLPIGADELLLVAVRKLHGKFRQLRLETD